MSDLRPLVLGTRGSTLAVTQSQHVADAVTAATGVPVRLQIITTRGDRDQQRPLAELGGKGLFTAELEQGLRDGVLDFAVHSLKDLPTDDADGLVLGCVPAREDPRDALVGSTLEGLPQGAVVGTGSLRRAAQLRALRPDLDIQGIRGNVETRIGKRDAGQYDAIVLAMAGVNRLGITRPDLHPLSAEQMCPAVGQGALAVQCRADDPRVLGLLAHIHDAVTARCVAAERAFLAAYGGGCNVPAACFAVPTRDGVSVTAVATVGGGALKRVTGAGPDPAAVGARLAGQLTERGL
jgi:hydroxymethylbilane synthase